MKKNIEILWQFGSLFVFILFSSCEKEDSMTNEKSNKSTINLQSISTIEEKIYSNTSSRISQNNILNYIIPEDIIVWTNSNTGKKTYSIALNLIQQDTLSNLVVIENDSLNYDYFLYEYTSINLDQWKSDIKNGVEPNIQPTINISKLHNFHLRSNDCYASTTEWICPSGMHRTGQENQCTYSTREWILTVTQMTVPCDGGGGGGGGTTTTPNINAGTPCGGLQAKSNDADYKAKMAELKTKAATQNVESAYITYQNTPKFSQEYQGNASLEGGSLIQFQLDTSRNDQNGLIHCHLDATSKRNFAVFSLTDLIYFKDIIQNSTASNCTLMVTSAKGTFAIVVTNKTAFMNMANEINNQGHMAEFGFAVYVNYKESGTKQLEGFLQFFKTNSNTTIQNTGFEVFSCDENFSNWKKRGLNSNNKVTETPC